MTPPAEGYEAYRGTSYFPFLDGLRYVLVAFVVADHAGNVWPFIQGGLAVLVFFVISGFLITTLLCREESAGDVDLRSFFRRRLFRIVPLYYVVLSIYLVLIHLTHSIQQPGFGNVWNHLTFTSEFTESRSFGQAWSLGIEEKFYLAWPLLGFVVVRRPLGRALLCGARTKWAETNIATVGYPVAVALLLGWVLTKRGGRVPFLQWGPMRYGGRLSYAIYLTHMLTILALHSGSDGTLETAPGWTIGVVLALSTIVAIPFHHLVELPMINRGRRRPAARAGPATALAPTRP